MKEYTFFNRIHTSSYYFIFFQVLNQPVMPSIDSLASMSAPRSSVVISLSFITAMIATSSLQNYEKVIEYSRFFSKNLK